MTRARLMLKGVTAVLIDRYFLMDSLFSLIKDNPPCHSSQKSAATKPNNPPDQYFAIPSEALTQFRYFKNAKMG